MRVIEKIPEHLREQVARAAHAVWHQLLLNEGWTSGDRFDAEAKVHPGLRPFDQLSPFQRDLIADWVDDEDVGSSLRSAVACAMLDRELRAADMTVGALVRLLRDDPTEPIDPEDDYVGRIVEWTLRRPEIGRLESIKVSWPGGEMQEYPPGDLELAEPPPAAP